MSQTNDPATPYVAFSFINDIKPNDPSNQPSNQPNKDNAQGQEVAFIQPAGPLFHLLVSGATLLDSENQPLGKVLTLVDITTHKQMEETLREARDQLEQRVIEPTVELLATNEQLQQEIEERKQAEVALTEVRQRLSQIQESERLLLARELHDGPLQEVIGMAFDLLLLTQMWELRLYIAGQTPKCLTAFANLKRICDEHLPGQYQIEVIDLLENPRLAREDQILAIPTLVRKLPMPLRKIIGDLSNREGVLVGLDVNLLT